MEQGLTHITDVFVAGSIAYDDIMDFPYEFKHYFHPEYLHQINVSFVVRDLKRQLGGTATSLAYNFSLLLKRQTVAVLSAIGKDGDEFLRFFHAKKISSSYITQDTRLYTATGKVITDIKNNQIWGFYYGASERFSKTTSGALKKDTSLLVLSATHKKPFLKLQKEAIKNKASYVYDPGMVLTWITDVDLKKGVLGSSMIFANDYEMNQITKRLGITVGELCKRGICVVTTLGESGVLYQDNHQKIQVSGYKIKKVVDPTGAGDGFRAGFLSGLISGLSLSEALKQGNALASIVIEKYGTTNHAPTKKQIRDRMSKLKITNLK